MSAREPQPRPWSPAGRAAALILRPRRTWRTIAQEPADGAQLYRNLPYIAVIEPTKA